MTPEEILCSFTMQGVPIVPWIMMTLQTVSLDPALLHDDYALTHTTPTSFRSILQVEVGKKNQNTLSALFQ